MMAAVWDTKLLGSGETPGPLARERPAEGSCLGAAESAVSRGERPYETAGLGRGGCVFRLLLSRLDTCQAP